MAKVKAKARGNSVTTCMEEKWEIESAANTLMRAEEIKADPELFKKAYALLEKQKKAIENVSAGISVDGE